MHREFDKIDELLDYALLTPDLFGKGVYVTGKVDLALAQSISEAIGVQTWAFVLPLTTAAFCTFFAGTAKKQPSSCVASYQSNKTMR